MSCSQSDSNVFVGKTNTFKSEQLPFPDFFHGFALFQVCLCLFIASEHDRGTCLALCWVIISNNIVTYLFDYFSSVYNFIHCVLCPIPWYIPWCCFFYPIMFQILVDITLSTSPEKRQVFILLRVFFLKEQPCWSLPWAIFIAQCLSKARWPWHMENMHCPLSVTDISVAICFLVKKENKILFLLVCLKIFNRCSSYMSHSWFLPLYVGIETWFHDPISYNILSEIISKWSSNLLFFEDPWQNRDLPWTI